jgi:ribosome-associated protein
MLPANTSLPAAARHRLRRLAGQRLVDDGSILITARSERSQDQNRREALGRLESLIRQALIEPKIRKKTRPTRASKERRIDSKKRRGTTKQQRQGPRWE